MAVTKIRNGLGEEPKPADLKGSSSINVLLGDLEPGDEGLFFGRHLKGGFGLPWKEELEPNDIFVYLDEEPKDMAELIVLIGKAKSKGEARDAGWVGKLPIGFTEWTQIGKIKWGLWVLNARRRPEE